MRARRGWVSLFLTWYTWLIRLYPRAFRAEFEGEMVTVFAQIMTEAAEKGWRQLFRIAVTEFGTLPLNIFKEWWALFRQRKHTMSRTNVSQASGPVSFWQDDRGRGASRRDIFLAALPHLLFASLMALSNVYTGRFLGIVPLAALVVAFLVAWRQGWPLWSGSWAGYWLMLLFILTSSLSIFSMRPGSVFDFLVLLALALMALFIFQRRPLYGLLATFPPLMMLTRLFAFELVLGGDWIEGGLWLLLALTSAGIVWLGSVHAGVLLALSYQLVAGAAYTLGNALLPFRFRLMGPRQTPQLKELINDFTPLTLSAIAIILAFLLLHPLSQLAGRGGQRSRRYFTLLRLGAALTFGGFFGLRSSATGGTGSEPLNILLTLALTGGIILSLASALLLARAAWPGSQYRIHTLLLPLLAALAPLMVLALPSPTASDGLYSSRFQLQIFFSYLGVLVWTSLAVLILIWRPGGTPSQDNGPLRRGMQWNREVGAETP